VRLQQAHEDLHAQSELARTREDTLYQIERTLTEANGESPEQTLQKLKALIASRS
jgi:hypothetical protein